MGVKPVGRCRACSQPSLILTLFIVPMYLWLAPDELSEPLKIGRGNDDKNRNDGPRQAGEPPSPRPAQRRTLADGCPFESGRAPRCYLKEHERVLELGGHGP